MLLENIMLEKNATLHFAICWMLTIFALVHGGDKISIKRVDAYTKIWTDRNSGASEDVSIWRPVDPQNGFYALGDVAVNSHGTPQSSAVMVRELESGALKEPTSFEQIWNDEGSGASEDVAIYRMKNPSGYTCLGNVAINHHKVLPSKSLYRCVKDNYLTGGLYELIWNDKGSGAKRDVSLWRVFKNQANVHGVGANTFMSHASHNTLSGTPKVLDSRYTIDEQLLPTPDSVVISLYPTPGKTRIWSDKGSGASWDFSCWRPNTYDSTFRMGDVPVRSHGQPNGGFIAKGRASNIFTNPTGYDLIWTDRGSGASQDGSFWRPRCPSGYRYISYACSGNHGPPPNNAVSCVKAEHTVSGYWQLIWTDRGSGAADDAKVYMARSNSNGQEVNGLGALKNSGSVGQAYVLKASSVRYIDSKPVKKYEITSVNYDLSKKSILDSKLDDLKVAYLENNSPDCQKIISTVAETVEESHTWSVEKSIEVGVEMSVEAGIPGLGTTTFTVSTTVSSSYGTEDTKTTSKEVSTSVEGTVRPCYKMPVTLRGRRFTTDVPYTAQMTVTYTDNTKANVNVQGTYKGVTVSEATAHLGNPIKIGGCTHKEVACGSD